MSVPHMRDGFWLKWLNFIYHIKKWLQINYKCKKQPQKFHLKVKKSSIVVKHAYSGDEIDLYSCCCLKHLWSQQKCHNLHNVLNVIFAFVQRTVQASLRIFLQIKVIVDGVKFNSHDSGSHIQKSMLQKALYEWLLLLLSLLLLLLLNEYWRKILISW